MSAFARIFSVIIVIWLLGFGLYAMGIQLYSQDLNHQPQAVVVLTGGSNRIEEGLDIMSKFGCDYFFISGVNRNVSRHDILKRIQSNHHVEQCHLELGYTARNTHENAQEVISWLEKKKFTKIVLVTAYYHMPRSIIEFQAIDSDLEIQPYAVYPDQTQTDTKETAYKKGFFLFKEYNKLLAAWIRINFFNNQAFSLTK